MSYNNDDVRYSKSLGYSDSGIWLIILVFFGFMFVAGLISEARDLSSGHSRTKTEIVISPGDSVVDGVTYVGVTGNTVEFQSGDKILKYEFAEGKELKWDGDRSVTLKKISGDSIVVKSRSASEDGTNR